MENYMELLTIRIDKMAEEEIRSRLQEIDEKIEIRDIKNPKTPGTRQPMGLEPFTYFVIVYSAHLAASISEQVFIKMVLEKFKDKNPQDSDK